ncbi:MAG: phage holin family protein, partial [Chitinivibrionales bacterium]|nr:phage holin family protein [Chitinivibrionales bacterium]MBD3355565.1 phage holin family protein [Chitinivibrionales bacterium]
RQQIELAKTEMSEKASRLTRNTVSLVVGGLVAYTGVLYFLQFLNWGGRELLQLLGLAEGVTFWLMPLILGTIIGLVGYVLIRKAIKTLKHTNLAPEKTVHSIKEDRQWLNKKR